MKCKLMLILLILGLLTSCGGKGVISVEEGIEEHGKKMEVNSNIEANTEEDLHEGETNAEIDMHAGEVKPKDKTLEIGEGVYSYTSNGSGFSMFVVTTEGVIAIESYNTDHSKKFLAAIKAVTDQPIKYLIHSHNHWDHSSGGQVFLDAGATTIAHKEAADWMKAHLGPDMVAPTETWEGSQKLLTLGETTIELTYYGENHGLGMTVVRLPEQKIAFIADLVTPNRVLFTIVPDFNVKELEGTITELLDMDFEKAIFSHNEASNPLEGGTKEDLQATLDFISDLRAAIFAEFKKGTPSMQVPSIVRVPKYKDLAHYDDWLHMNAWKIMLEEFMGPMPGRTANPDNI